LLRGSSLAETIVANASIPHVINTKNNERFTVTYLS
jgi:hypothetical protein